MKKVRNTLWSNRSKKGKVGIILLALMLIGAATGGTSSTTSSTAPAAKSAAPAAAAPAPKPKAPAITGKVRGYFSRSLLDGPIDQADLAKYIRAGNVWCGWRDGKVLVHVTMTNDSAEHVTVYWNPRYAIQAGGIHGDGMTAAEDDGFDSGETRSLISEQEPKGSRPARRWPRAPRTLRCWKVVEIGAGHLVPELRPSFNSPVRTHSIRRPPTTTRPGLAPKAVVAKRRNVVRRGQGNDIALPH